MVPLERLAALCSLSGWAEDECGLEVEFPGCGGLAPRYAFKLEMTGRYLSYEVRFIGIDSFGLYVSAMDRGDSPVSVALMATKANWQRVRAILSALESTRVRSLSPRPTELGVVPRPGDIVIM
jgi:hypothetical protein